MTDRSRIGATVALTVIRWQLNIASWCVARVSAFPAEPDKGYLRRAQQTYQSILETLPRANLSESQRAQLEQELCSLKERLISFGMSSAD
jgi:hypothetical protein